MVQIDLYKVSKSLDLIAGPESGSKISDAAPAIVRGKWPAGVRGRSPREKI
jgi:hypothetical protein